MIWAEKENAYNGFLPYAAKSYTNSKLLKLFKLAQSFLKNEKHWWKKFVDSEFKIREIPAIFLKILIISAIF